MNDFIQKIEFGYSFQIVQSCNFVLMWCAIGAEQFYQGKH